MNTVDRIKRIFVWIFILGLSIIFIVAFTLPGGVVGHQSVLIGKVNGEEIKAGRYSKFVRYYQQYVNNFQDKGIEVNDYIENLAKKESFRAVAEQMIMKDYSIANAYSISDQELIDGIKQSQFMDEAGNFKSQEYENFKQRGSDFDKKLLEEEMRDHLLIQWTLYNLFDFTPVVSSEIEQRMEASRYQKSFIVGYLDLNDYFEEELNPVDISNYYLEHISNYDGKELGEVRTFVESDFINENAQELLKALKDKYTLALLEKRDKFQSDFVGAFRSLGMKFFETAPVRYFDTEVLDRYSQNSISELSSLAFIRKAMVLKRGEVSVPIEIEEALAIAFVKSEKRSSLKNADAESFVLEKTTEELQKEKSSSLQNAFKENLYNSSKIVSKLEE